MKLYCHLAAIRMGMNKMVEDDEYSDYLNTTLEKSAKAWNALFKGVA